MAQVLAEFDTAHSGFIHDAQLDFYGERLATASADSRIRLWDVKNPEVPAFLADLEGHSGAVYQVAWANPEFGLILASVSADGDVIIWGQRSSEGDWSIVHRESLGRYGAARSVSWAPSDHGLALACALEDGTVLVLTHVLQDTGPGVWQSKPITAHSAEASAVSWASSPHVDVDVTGRRAWSGPRALNGARLASAGGDGVKVWRYDDARTEWIPEPMAETSQTPARDVAWRPWNGVQEALAVANGNEVKIFVKETDASAAWKLKDQVPVGYPIWRLSWSTVGGALQVSCGDDEQRLVILKEHLSGSWEAMEVTQDGQK